MSKELKTFTKETRDNNRDDAKIFRRTSIDNALKAAFRKVFGYDPINDVIPEGVQFTLRNPVQHNTTSMFQGKSPPIPKPTEVELPLSYLDNLRKKQGAKT